MKIVQIASICLGTLSLLASGANAQQGTKTVALKQTLQPVTRSYPRVAADILGIKTGMTVSQVETIAEKTYPGKPEIGLGTDTYSYKVVEAQSHPFVKQITFINQTKHSRDVLELDFGSPVSGNTLYKMNRDISYSQVLNAPLVSTLKASLRKKYGPVSSYQDNRGDDMYTDVWRFKQGSQSICKHFCMQSWTTTQISDLKQLDPTAPPLVPGWNQRGNALSAMDSACGSDNQNDFTIVARIFGFSADKTKVSNLDVSIWDSTACVDDTKGAMKQLKAAAIGFYNSASKTPAAPKL